MICSTAPPLPAIALLLLIAIGACGKQGDAPAVLAVASSLRNVMPELIERFRVSHGTGEWVATYGGSGTLRAQVEAGAPIDAIVFAGSEPVDLLIGSGALRAASRREVAQNSLVLVGPIESRGLRFESLAQLGSDQKLVIGLPDSAPVGSYARQALKELELWEDLQDRIVYAGHVAAVLAYVRRGEAAAGIVYRTDAQTADDVELLDTLPERARIATEIVAAVSSRARHPQRADAFVRFLGSAGASGILKRGGFEVTLDDGSGS